MMSNFNVSIIGAGLSGLAAAITLQNRGFKVKVLEKTDRPGGQVKTDDFQGFKLDHGFQIFLTSYPLANQLFKGRCHPFKSDAKIYLEGKFYDPAHFLTYFDKIKSPYTYLFKLPSLKPKANALETIESLGMSKSCTDHFLKPFFRGVLLDKELIGPGELIPFTLNMFIKGKAVLPDNGMGEIANALASQVDEIHYNTNITTLSENMLIATDPWNCAQLLNQKPPMPGRVVTTFYYSSNSTPVLEPLLLLNGGEGLINHIAPLSVVNPTYAPVGKHLFSVNVLGEALESQVRKELSEWFPISEKWTFLKSIPVYNAHPANYPLSFIGNVTAGAYKTAPSIEFAIRSGIDAAETYIKSIS